ncbi:arabinofuranosyltransferase [Risungbinella massiliensis]|uniref:arabinofuranosyltransferase n=1 Tax=Risungbinella massiliensis TaxID=1329796 RepID=UPI0005CBB44E|nr:arabinofuranosyltransferase [Risungbinella massiliensis]
MSLTQKKRITFLLYLTITFISSIGLKLVGIPNYKIWEKLFPNLLWLGMILGILWILFQKRVRIVSENTEWWTVLWFGYLFTLFNVFVLRNTYFSYSGVESDLEFVTAAITKYANYHTFVDFTYKDLAAFYPPLYFYILGKIAAIIGIEPYQIVRYALFALAAILPPMIYLLWSRLISKRFSMVFTISLFLLLHVSFFHKQYEFLSLALIIPWWFTYAQPKVKPDGRKRYFSLLVGGILGAILFQTYYYWFFLMILYLILQFWVSLYQKRSWQAAMRLIGHPLLVLVVVAFFSALFWLPLLINLFEYGVYPSQAHYFKQYMLDLPLRFSSMSDFAFAIGFIALIFMTQINSYYKRFGWLMITCIVWQMLGHVGLAIGKPLLHFKMLDFLHLLTLIGIAGIINWVTNLDKFKEYAKTILATVLILLIMVNGQIITDFQYGEAYRKAVTESKPSDVKYVQQNLDYKGKVFLTDQYKLHSFLPTYDFISWGVFYSHHSGMREERIEFLDELSKFHNPVFISYMLRNNRFDQIDFLYLKDKNVIEFTMDPYPNVSRSELEKKKISFDSSALTGGGFVDKGRGILQITEQSDEVVPTFTEEEKRFAKRFLDPKLLKQIKI